MTAIKNFYDEQDDLTAAKIVFYQKYIENYLFKLLMGFGKCLIADLFCGTGKNGTEKGSAIVLIEEIKYALTSDILKRKNPVITILFNDGNKACIDELSRNISQIEKPANIRLIFKDLEFKLILEKIKAIKDKNLPKFIFLDPFTYSDIKISDLKDLLSLGNVEILLFLPAFHAYRFKICDQFKADHKTRVFLEQFTTLGMYNYVDFDQFIDSIKEKLRSELSIRFVRPIVLDAGSRKNALFLITNSREGALVINKIAFKVSDDGRGISVNGNGQKSLFGIEGEPRFRNFSQNLHDILKSKKLMSNNDVIDFTLQEGFLPKHAVTVLQGLVKRGIIKLTDRFGNDTKKYYVSADPKENITIFRYIENGNQQSNT